MAIVAVANQKGGVGKTTTAINLSAFVAAAGRRVLLLDLDAQANASTGLGVSQLPGSNDSYQLLMGAEPLPDPIELPGLPNFCLLPATIDLAGAEIEMSALDGREHQLRDVLARWPATATFDFIIIDCPPSLGLTTLNAFVAANSILIPLQCEYYALEGLSALTRTVESVRRRFNPKLRIQGIVPTMHDRRANLSDLVVDEARKYFGDWVYNTSIPRNIRLSESPSHGQPISRYDPKSPGAIAYRSLAAEFLERETQLGSRAKANR